MKEKVVRQEWLKWILDALRRTTPYQDIDVPPDEAASRVVATFLRRKEVATVQEKLLVALLLLGKARRADFDYSVYYASPDARFRMLGSQFCLQSGIVETEFSYLLGDPIMLVRRAAILAARRSSCTAVSSCPAWHARLFDSSYEVRRDAIWAADRNPAISWPVQSHVVAILRENNARLRNPLLIQLDIGGRPGWADDSVSADLMCAFAAAADPEIAQAGLRYLEKRFNIDDDRAIVIQCLVLALTSGAEDVVRSALSQISRRRLGDCAFLSHFLCFLESDKGALTWMTARAVGFGGLRHPDVIEALGKWLNSGDLMTRMHTAEALVLLRAENVHAMEILVRDLSDSRLHPEIARRIEAELRTHKARPVQNR